MRKVTVRDVILANILAAILVALFASLWVVSAVLTTRGATDLVPLSKSVAETMYKVGRYDLLRDTAVNCEKSFDQLVSNTLKAQGSIDWTTLILVFGLVGMLVFNAWFLRGIRREMDALRSNPLMQPTGQQRAGG